MVEYSYVRIWQGLVYHSNGPQVEFGGAKLESVVLGGYQVLNIGGGGVHGVRESPNGLYTNETYSPCWVWVWENSGRVALFTVFAIVAKVLRSG